MQKYLTTSISETLVITIINIEKNNQNYERYQIYD